MIQVNIVTGVTHFENTMMYSMQRMMPFLSNTFFKNLIYTWIKSKALKNKEDRNLSSLQNKLSTNQPQPIHGLQTYLSTKCALLKNILLLSQYHNLNNSITISFF